KALGSKAEVVRVSACKALGDIGPDAKEATPDLILLLADPDVFRQAVLSLGKIGKPAVPALIKALDSPDDEVRRGAAMTLGHIGPQAEDAVPRLTDVSAKDLSPQVKAAASLALKRIQKGK